jgi:phosphatidylglycerol:prolipoprotein diacylglycerol transferase
MMSDYIFWTVATGFVLSHVFDAIFYHPETVARNPLYLLKIWDGLSSYGGFAGAVIGSLAWKYYRRQKVLGLIDITVSAMPLAWVFGRAGCSVVHDHPGILSDSWLAVRFPPRQLLSTVDWIHWGPPFIGRLDLGLLEFLLTIPLAIAVAVLWKRNPNRPDGYYIAVVCLSYSPVRFVLDFLRVSPEVAVLGADPRYGGLTPAQWASMGLFVVAAVVFRRVLQTQRRQAGGGDSSAPPEAGADGSSEGDGAESGGALPESEDDPGPVSESPTEVASP